jgi:hypothetical protein
MGVAAAPHRRVRATAHRQPDARNRQEAFARRAWRELGKDFTKLDFTSRTQLSRALSGA